MVLGVAIYETIFSAVLPGPALNTSLISANIPDNILNQGVCNAFIAGVVMCAAGFVLSLLAKEDRKGPGKKSGESFVA